MAPGTIAQALALVLAGSSLLASPVLAGAPLKGVDVKLGKNPGGKAREAAPSATPPGAPAPTGTDGRLLKPGATHFGTAKTTPDAAPGGRLHSNAN